MRWLYLIPLIFLVSCGNKDEKSVKDPLPDNDYWIAYNVLTDSENDNYEVFSMNMDGNERRNITRLPGVEWTYYAYDKDLYFISDKDTAQRHYFLYKTDFLGSNPRKIFNVRLADSWMSSRNKGEELIVKPHKSVDTAFYIINNSGKVLDTIRPRLAYFNDPVFSPDGKSIVFRGALYPFKKDSGYLDELYKLELADNKMIKLTSYPIADTTAQWYNYHAGPPRYHPGGEFITYQSRQNGKSSLFAVSPDGKRQWKLTDNDSLQQGWHDWSPDGNWLAIEVFDLNSTQFHIELMNWNTKESRILTDTTYKYQQAPVFVETN